MLIKNSHWILRLYSSELNHLSSHFCDNLRRCVVVRVTHFCDAKKIVWTQWTCSTTSVTIDIFYQLREKMASLYLFSFNITHTHTHTHTYTNTHSLSHTHRHSLTHTFYLSLSHTRTHTHTTHTLSIIWSAKSCKSCNVAQTRRI